MTSAALHSVPHQSASTVTNPSVAALSSGRTYSSSRPQTRESYYSSPNSTSPSARRSSRKSSAGNAVHTTNKSSQSSHRVSISSPSPSVSCHINSLPTISTGISAENTTMPPGEIQRGYPPVISPRISSNRTPHNSSVLIDRSSSRRSGYRETSNSPRPTVSSDSQQTRDRQRSNQTTPQSHRTTEDGSAATPKTRRRHVSQGETSPEPLIENRERKAATMSTGRRKTGTSIGTHTPTGPSREASEVLNRIIISHPEEDIERERERMAEAIPTSKGTPVSVTANDSGGNNTTRGTRSRHDYAASLNKREKNTKFGEYFLGGTLGEGEFGKVKMGWKKEGGVQVAIKLIRRDNVGSNPSRLAKIHREIAILEGISHPNIVRLHEMVQTEKQIGIILEYASGGELFDYILNHRYLNDNAARRLFAQLVSGVGYLHNKGIVHRDLKLENLLLDRNRNIIITDFGFANTFNAEDELGEEIEYNLTNKDFVKKFELDKVLPNGHRRGDLMQTSCGSPCYAAPELVVSDSLYTGRKVDVWSCGVILYAMLAGYLPFDDDPANPEGDNINLLYKYIVSTPLTFPDYVSPHARDLLRRILVPDPRKRADLFEVARHSWLAEYAHVVSFITSRVTASLENSSTSIHKEGRQDTSMLSRSASVQDSTKNQKSTSTNGELPRKYCKTDLEINESRKISKDNKRRTVQVEYVAPRSQTQRGPHASGTSNGPIQTGSKRRVRSGSHTPAGSVTSENPNLHESRKEVASTTHGRRPSTANRSQNTSQAVRREPHSASETVHYVSSHSHPPVSLTRPATGGSMNSSGSRPASMHLTSRGSYSQPVAPELAGTNVQGRMAQPKSGKINYAQPVETEPDSRRGSFIVRALSRLDKVQGDSDAVSRNTSEVKDIKGHRRSNTIGTFFSRTNSVFGIGGGRRGSEEKSSKKYPPVSMSGSTIAKEENPRLSVDSRRSISFGFGRKRSGSISKSHTNNSYDKSKRFSLIPTTFSFKAIGISKDGSPFDADFRSKTINNKHEYTEPPRTVNLPSVRLHSSTGTTTPISFIDGQFEQSSENLNPNNQSAFSVSNEQSGNHLPVQQQYPPLAFRSGRVNEPESSIMEAINNHRGELIVSERSNLSQQNYQKAINGRGMLQKNNRRFADAYEQELNKGYGTNNSDHGGSSGAARKVMDFFRRRGRDRAI